VGGGALIGVISALPNLEGDADLNGGVIVAVVLGMAAVGALFGSIIGATMDTWDSVPIDNETVLYGDEYGTRLVFEYRF
jgi:phage-related tail protein